MTTGLLRIALTVQQHEDGHYYWALIEAADVLSKEYELLVESSQGFATYDSALAQGYDVLRRMPEDAGVGPRSTDRMPDEEPASWSQWDSIDTRL